MRPRQPQPVALQTMVRPGRQPGSTGRDAGQTRHRQDRPSRRIDVAPLPLSAETTRRCSRWTPQDACGTLTGRHPKMEASGKPSCDRNAERTREPHRQSGDVRLCQLANAEGTAARTVQRHKDVPNPGKLRLADILPKISSEDSGHTWCINRPLSLRWS